MVTEQSSERRLVKGWHGRFFEDFEVGDIYKHPYGRTITETDDVWLSNISMNLNPMHFNEEYASRTEFGQRLVNGVVTLLIATGMSVIDVSQNSTAALGIDKIQLHNPVFHGDTIYSESEVLMKRESESRDHVGIVSTELRAFNQDGEMVMSLERSNFILKREFADPSAGKPPGWPEGVGTQVDDL